MMRASWATDPTYGEQYEVPRRTDTDESLIESLVLGLALLALMLPWYTVRHPVISLVIGGSVWLYLMDGPVWLAVAHSALVVLLVVWRLMHRSSFTRFVSRPARSRWRGLWVYRVRWKTAMHMCGLVKALGAKHYAPHIVKVRSDAYADRVRVKLLMGQCTDDFEAKADALAATFGATECRVETVKPGVVWLHFTHRDALVEPVPALEISQRVDLEALPLGVRDDGQRWLLRLLGTHVLVVGSTGAGKGSVVWSTIRALIPGVRDRLVQVWAVDPKGGVELAPGAPLFTRFAYDPEDMVKLVEDAAKLVRDRAGRMRGVSRLHEPSTVEPFILLVVDELAFLTAYMPDRALSKRLHAALSTVLSQGRAVGVSVIGAVQDPRKEVVGMRDLFPTRIALRLAEPPQVDMVLGDGVRDRGARCDKISTTTPGVGYVVLDGHREPARVRAALVTDDDIATMSRECLSGAAELSPTAQHVVAGEVVS